MSKSVKWTKTAARNFTEIKKYLEAEWGNSVRDSFIDKVEEFTSLIKEFPSLGSTEVESKGIKGFKLTKQVRIFYRIKSDTIIILALFDVRQNPSKRPK